MLRPFVRTVVLGLAGALLLTAAGLLVLMLVLFLFGVLTFRLDPRYGLFLILLFVASMFTATLSALGYSVARRLRRRIIIGCCPRCGYNYSMARCERCPECGEIVRPEES